MIRVILFSTTFLMCAVGAPPSQAAERWECENKNGNLPQSVTLEIEDGKPVSIEYNSMAPSPNGDTYYSCPLSAARGKPESVWSDEGKVTTVALKDSSAPDDTITITRNTDRYVIELSVSSSNCPPSVPLAATISIIKNKKKCADIEMSG